jgi:hypothetical protein
MKNANPGSLLERAHSQKRSAMSRGFRLANSPGDMMSARKLYVLGAKLGIEIDERSLASVLIKLPN